jgi:type I restriction enzyme M protein
VSGWKVEINKIKNKKGQETGWTHDLIPKNIGVDKYFSKEQEAIDNLTAETEKVTLQMQTLEEENDGENDLLSDARNASGKITKTEVTKRIKEIRSNWEFGDELKILQNYLRLLEQVTEINGKIKDAETSLDNKLLVRYRNLTEDEIKALVTEDKWLKSLHDSVKNEMERISQKLAGRIKELAERYGKPLPALVKEVEERARKVDNHLVNMGFKW